MSKTIERKPAQPCLYHWRMGDYLYLRNEGANTLMIHAKDDAALREQINRLKDEAKAAAKRARANVERIESYLAGKTTESPYAVLP